MGDQTLNPSGDSSIHISYPPYPSNAHYNNTVAMDSGSWQTDLYTLPNPVRDGIITNVSVHFWGRANSAHDHNQRGRTAISIGGSTYFGSENPLYGGAASDYYTDYALNPKTSANWTWTELDSLLAGVSLIAYSSSYSYAVSDAVWVVVTSVPVSAGGAQIIGLPW